GHYKAYLDSGNYTISYLPNASFTQTSAPLTYNAPVPPSYTGDDFGAYSTQALYNQYFYVWHHPMRCQPSQGYTYIDITNNGYLSVQGSITMVHSPNMTLNTAVPAPDVISGDTLTWYYSVLAPGQSFHIGGANGMNWIAFNDPSAGQTVWYSTMDSVFDLLGNPLTQYADSFSFVVTCSCDPNDKEVSPYGVAAQHFTAPNTELTYTINFQNTGNDTAFNVVVTDTLDSNLDWNTFEVISSTDPVHTQMDANGVVKFTFENIYLPDSNVNEPASHGAVAYHIRTDSLLPDPTEITNTAYIFFDWNPAVITNTTLNTITTLSAPIAAFTTGDLSFCPGSCINFANQSTSGATYLWSFPGGTPSSSTSTNPTGICYTVSGFYDVSLITTNALGSDTSTLTNYLEVFTVAPQAIAQSGDTLIANSGFVNYVWYYNGNIINGANSYYYVATQNGDYHVISFDANGCDVEAAVFNVLTDVRRNPVDAFEIYPNPVTDRIEIRGASGSVISIYNVLGEKLVDILSATVDKNKSTEVDMSKLPQGIYTVEITSGQNMFRTKVVKQ
ncbi:MAG: T9SS type A sorting domain-containing protein, partial [Bacteroidota bacterium]